MPDGSVLGLAEGREHGTNDPGFNNDIDLVYKLSRDGGRT